MSVETEQLRKQCRDPALRTRNRNSSAVTGAWKQTGTDDTVVGVSMGCVGVIGVGVGCAGSGRRTFVNPSASSTDVTAWTLNCWEIVLFGGLFFLLHFETA
eukprot:GILI01038688.1.p3 GENE.GILI01038688.1~~GILI01038688.1.p3  ORF type:complete len:101 (+),score=1.29 GILI01038688.1:351-653(+)